MIDNKGKNTLIFGVRNDSSIAWQVALKLLESGSNVALSVEHGNYAIIKKMTAELNIDVYAADIRKDDEVKSNVTEIMTKWKQIDFLLHAVAYGNHNVMCSAPPRSKEKPPEFIDIPFDDFSDSFNISAFSFLRVCKICRPFLAEKASILTLTYQASQRVFYGYAGMAINKAALENMVKYLAWFFGSSNIRVNAISAGLVMTTSAGGIKGVRKLRKTVKNNAPLGNILANDVANATLYYFSDLSNKVTGNIHYVDGGFNIMAISD